MAAPESNAPEVYEDVQKFILKCGDFAQATYDAFDSGKSLYDKDNLFSELKVVSADNYKIHSFLYATTAKSELAKMILVDSSDLSGMSNWFGYVAYTTDEKNLEIFVVLRGNRQLPYWIREYSSNMSTVKRLLIQDIIKDEVPDSFFSGDAKVHSGWLSVYTTPAVTSTGQKESLEEQIRASVKYLADQNTHLEANVVVTGHSLGGALATLAAYDLAVNKIGTKTNDSLKVRAVVFSTPPCGNEAFMEQVDKTKNLDIDHFWVIGDPVPQHARVTGLLEYVPIEKRSQPLIWSNSPYLENFTQETYFNMVHDLEVVLHLIAGFNIDGSFEFKGKGRSPVLINKYTDAYDGAPGYWWKTKEGLHYDETKQEWEVDETWSKN